MLASRTTWQGALARAGALTLLTLALCGAVALCAPSALAAPVSTAAATSCGSAQSACGPQVCHAITPADLSQPDIAPLGDARAQLSQARGINSSALSLSGSGWPAGVAIEVSLATYNGSSFWVDPVVIAKGMAGANGDLSIANFTPPQIIGCMTPDLSESAPDPVLLVVQAPEQARVSLVYTIYPSPLIQARTVPALIAGMSLTLTGSGWDPSQQVTITPAVKRWPDDGYPNYGDSTFASTFTPLSGHATTITSQPDGSFSAYVTLPIEPPETQITYLASATSPVYGAFTVSMNAAISVLPTTSATLTLSGSGALAGGFVRLSGANWPPSQTLQVSYCRGAILTYCDPSVSQQLALVHADSAGRLDARITIPANARPGPITIQVRPLATPFPFETYARSQPFSVLYPWDQTHPRLALAIHAWPFAAAGLIIALIALVGWNWGRRRARKAAADV